MNDLDKQLQDTTEETLLDILPGAFAVVKDTCRRLVGREYTAGGLRVKWDMVPFDVQLMGGVVLHQGKISEMATGEGKTLVATLPIYLNALTGKGVHIITVNDYLLAEIANGWVKFLNFTDSLSDALLMIWIMIKEELHTIWILLTELIMNLALIT